MELEESDSGITLEEIMGTDKTAPRPHCPECNSNNVTSSGVAWLCNVCGRRFTKIYRPSQRVRGREDIFCPQCNANNPRSDGNRWRCTKCKKTWYKESNMTLHRALGMISLLADELHEKADGNKVTLTQAMNIIARLCPVLDLQLSINEEKFASILLTKILDSAKDGKVALKDVVDFAKRLCESFKITLVEN